MSSGQIATEQVTFWRAGGIKPEEALRAMQRPSRGGWDAVFLAVMVEAERMSATLPVLA